MSKGERLPPCEEDVTVFRRNMRRILRWNAENRQRPDPFGRELRAINNACKDYMEFKK